MDRHVALAFNCYIVIRVYSDILTPSPASAHFPSLLCSLTLPLSLCHQLSIAYSSS